MNYPIFNSTIKVLPQSILYIHIKHILLVYSRPYKPQVSSAIECTVPNSPQSHNSLIHQSSKWYQLWEECIDVSPLKLVSFIHVVSHYISYFNMPLYTSVVPLITYSRNYSLPMRTYYATWLNSGATHNLFLYRLPHVTFIPREPDTSFTGYPHRYYNSRIYICRQFVENKPSRCDCSASSFWFLNDNIKLIQDIAN